MSKATLGQAVMVAILTVIPALALAPAASAAPPAVRAAGSRVAATVPVTKDPVGTVVNAAVGGVLDVAGGVVCGVVDIAASLAQTLGIDPTGTADVIAFCDQFLPTVATEATQNAVAAGGAAGSVVNSILPFIRDASPHSNPAMSRAKAVAVPCKRPRRIGARTHYWGHRSLTDLATACYEHFVYLFARTWSLATASS